MKGDLEMNDKKTDGKKVPREVFLTPESRHYHFKLKNIVMSYGA